jgi:hypothetical protein
MRSFLAVMVVAGVVGVAAPARADAPKTMGEAAAKEKDKKKPTKVYTEDDLRNHGRSSGSYSQPAAEGTSTPAGTAEKKAEGDKKPAAGEKKEKTPDEERAEKQADWHQRLDQAQKDVATWQAEVERLQGSLNDNTQLQYGAGRQAKLDALATAKNNLAAANQTLSGLQEEGRRNSYR